MSEFSIRYRVKLRALWTLLAILVGCSEQESSGENGVSDDAGVVVDDAPGSPAAEAGTAAAAVAVIRDYYSAIQAHDYARAYDYWSNNGAASGQTLEEFRNGFRETASVNVDVGTPGRIDPAAGSRYIEIPVLIRARTTRGTAQCFSGSYTLRRSVVPGATPEQQQWRIASARIAERDQAACAKVSLGAARDSITQLVSAFGRRLAAVSLTASPAIVRREIREQYAAYITSALLENWLRRPSAAPGRAVSSPWPERIDVNAVQRLTAERYRVSASVVYVTSVERTQGGAARREPVTMEVTRSSDGSWRISEYDAD